VTESPGGDLRILVYVDGSDASMRAVDRAIELGVAGADLSALAVIPPKLDRAAVSQFEIEEEDLDARFAADALTRAADRIEGAGLSMTSYVDRGPVVECIAGRGRSGCFDVVLVGRKPGLHYVADLSDTLRRKHGLPVEVVP
jgi:nucleotide-binding universal stress UspA family protein